MNRIAGLPDCRIAVVAIGLAVVLATPREANAQQANVKLADAFELERAGRHGEAAKLYRDALRSQPGNLAALLGLERVTETTGYWDSVLIFVDLALAQDPGNRFTRGVELRTWARMGDVDSLAAAAQRWIEFEPENPDPYREWAYAVTQRGDISEAQRILTLGRDRLGNQALARELAQLWVATGEWVRAADYWASAVRSDAGQVANAALSLTGTNAALRPQVISVLTDGAPSDPGHLIAANLLAQWNRPMDGWMHLAAAVPQDPAQALGVLRSFVERTRRLHTTAAAAARGHALQRIAELTTGTFSEGARLEAARAFAEAGEREIAERLLEHIAVDSTIVSPAQAGAMASLIGVMADVGRVEQAETRFDEWRERLSLEDVQLLQRKIAWAWLMRGSVDRAEAVLEADSSIEVLAVKGWIALFHGDLRGATEYFREAGPMAGTRAEATLRTETMALIQLVRPDTVPALGEALLALHRGDSVAAVSRLESVALALPPDGGRAEVLSLAGTVAFELGDYGVSERLLLDALAAMPNSAFAPLSAYALAQTYVVTGRRDAAIERLESVILDYPASAVVPRARRLLDQVRGMVPRS